MLVANRFVFPTSGVVALCFTRACPLNMSGVNPILLLYELGRGGRYVYNFSKFKRPIKRYSSREILLTVGDDFRHKVEQH